MQSVKELPSELKGMQRSREEGMVLKLFSHSSSSEFAKEQKTPSSSAWEDWHQEQGWGNDWHQEIGWNNDRAGEIGKTRDAILLGEVLKLRKETSGEGFVKNLETGKVFHANAEAFSVLSECVGLPIDEFGSKYPSAKETLDL